MAGEPVPAAPLAVAPLEAKSETMAEPVKAETAQAMAIGSLNRSRNNNRISWSKWMCLRGEGEVRPGKAAAEFWSTGWPVG